VVRQAKNQFIPKTTGKAFSGFFPAVFGVFPLQTEGIWMDNDEWSLTVSDLLFCLC
jgi:hypothetical protein